MLPMFISKLKVIKFSSKLFVVIFVLFFCKSYVLAQISSSGFAYPVKIEDNDVAEGDIVCSNGSGFGLCDSEYNPEIYGVVTNNPSVAVEDTQDNSYLVQSSGSLVVRVKADNGVIKKGSLITSSKTKGVGHLATRNGYVLGVSMEDYNPQSNDEVGQVVVAINIHPAAGISTSRSNLIQVLREGLSAPLFEPLSALRYILASLILLVSFVLGFVYFGRVAKTGIEAIGRNPLAGKMIQFSVVLHIVITIVIVCVGLILAYLILIL